MSIAQENEVRAVLEDFHARLRRVVDDAWAEWINLPGRGRFLFPKRVRANIVFDAVARFALAEFADDPNIHVILKKQTVQFLFRDKVLLRFKKANKKGVGSNIETQAALSFIDPQLSIPGLLPEILKIEVCWTADDLGLGLQEVAVVHRDKTRRLWAYAIDRADTGANVVPIPFAPAQPNADAPPAVVPRRVRKDADRKGE